MSLNGDPKLFPMKFQERVLIWIAALIGYLAIDIFVHGIVLADAFWGDLAELGIEIADVNLTIMIVGMLYVSIPFSFFLTPYIERSYLQVALLGGFLGSMFIVPYHIINYAFFPDYPASFVLWDSLVSTGEFVLVGLVVKTVYTKFIVI